MVVACLNTSVMIFPIFQGKVRHPGGCRFSHEKTVHLMLGGWSDWRQSLNGWRVFACLEEMGKSIITEPRPVQVSVLFLQVVR